MNRLEPKHLARPEFAIVALVLLVGWVGQQSVVAALGWYLAKKPVPLRDRLETLPGSFGSYELVRIHDRLSEAEEAELGTEKYITYDYKDTSQADNTPGSIVTLHVAYYTGTPDAVPHVPERCVVGGGALARGSRSVMLELDSPLIEQEESGRVTAVTNLPMRERVTLPSTQVPLRVVGFVMPGETSPAFNVTYLFVANGEYTADSTAVRKLAFDLTDEYAYWCKVEVRPAGIPDPDAAAKVSEAFLSYAMPEIMRCLPDWEAVKAGEWPPKELEAEQTAE